MKKGIGRIVIGAAMIVFQVVMLIANLRTGTQPGFSLDSASAFFYDLFCWLGYFLIGAIGIILLVRGILAYKKNR